MVIMDPNVSHLNSYVGGAFQQATSVFSKTNVNCYELGPGCFSIYGFEVCTAIILRIFVKRFLMEGISINQGSMAR